MRILDHITAAVLFFCVGGVAASLASHLPYQAITYAAGCLFCGGIFCIPKSRNTL